MIFGMKIDDSEKGYERDKQGRDYSNNNGERKCNAVSHVKR